MNIDKKLLEQIGTLNEPGIEKISPMDIEKRSFEIITKELNQKIPEDEKASIIKRVIHTTADFEYADTLTFSKNAVANALEAIKGGASIVTDTQMVRAGINKGILESFGGEVYCFMSDADVAESAKKYNITRAIASMDKAAELDKELIFAIGNAPTALIRLYELINAGIIKPKLIIGVPVGFVNVEAAKELILTQDIDYIVARGRKGGSNVAASICNALLYMLKR